MIQISAPFVAFLLTILAACISGLVAWVWRIEHRTTAVEVVLFGDRGSTNVVKTLQETTAVIRQQGEVIQAVVIQLEHIQKEHEEWRKTA